MSSQHLCDLNTLSQPRVKKGEFCNRETGVSKVTKVSEIGHADPCASPSVPHQRAREARTAYAVVFSPLASDRPAIVRLRRLLKQALRQHQLTALDYAELPAHVDSSTAAMALAALIRGSTRKSTATSAPAKCVSSGILATCESDPIECASIGTVARHNHGDTPNYAACGPAPLQGRASSPEPEIPGAGRTVGIVAGGEK
jgi:hypothetical protein